MTTTSTDRIEKNDPAPRPPLARLARAHRRRGVRRLVRREAGGRVRAPAQRVTGHDHLPRLRARDVRGRPSSGWSRSGSSPAAGTRTRVEPGVDYSPEPTTLVEFQLEEVAGGTLLTVVESGFDAHPAARRAEAFRMNDGGWAEQMKNIERHVASVVARDRRRRCGDAAPLFAALGDETRLRLLGRLADGGPLSIARLTDGAEVTRQAITKHLHVLAGAGLVRGARRGRERVWELEPDRSRRRAGSSTRSRSSWDDALARLAAFVER